MRDVDGALDCGWLMEGGVVRRCCFWVDKVLGARGLDSMGGCAAVGTRVWDAGFTGALGVSVGSLRVWVFLLMIG